MANIVYPLAKQRLLEWASDGTGPPEGAAELCLVGVTSAYTYNAGHEDLNDLAGIVIPEVELADVTLTNGVIDATDPVLASMNVGQTAAAFVIYFKWASAELLLVYMDTPGDATLPQVISSEDGSVTFDATGIAEI